MDAIAARPAWRWSPLATHALPDDGSYFSFIRDIAATLAGALGLSAGVRGPARRPVPGQRVHAPGAPGGRAGLDRVRRRGHVRGAPRARVPRRRAGPWRAAGHRGRAPAGPARDGRRRRRGARDDRRRDARHAPLRGSRRTPRSGCCSWRCSRSASSSCPRSDSFPGDLVAILFGQVLGTSSGSSSIQARRRPSRWSPSRSCARGPSCCSASTRSRRTWPASPRAATTRSCCSSSRSPSWCRSRPWAPCWSSGCSSRPPRTGALLAHRVGSMMVIGVRRGHRRARTWACWPATGSTSRQAPSIVLVATGIFFVGLRADVVVARAAAARSVTPASEADLTGVATPSAGRARRRPRQPGRDVRGAAIDARGLCVGYPGDVVVEGIDLRVRGRDLARARGHERVGQVDAPPDARGAAATGRAARSPSSGRRRAVADARRVPRRSSTPRRSSCPSASIDVVRMARSRASGSSGRMTPDDHELVRWAMETMGVRAPRRTPAAHAVGRAAAARLPCPGPRAPGRPHPARRADAGLDAGGRERYLDAFAAELHRGAALDHGHPRHRRGDRVRPGAPARAPRRRAGTAVGRC